MGARASESGVLVVREAVLAAWCAGSLTALLAWLGPPGSDYAAHAYQRTVFLEHGFALWNNFWYSGSYSFVTYSVLYYPLAALLGIRLLAVATIATAAVALAVVLGREFGPAARWSSRSFAVVWAGVVLSAAFPFALGSALGLLGLWALQARRLWRFAVLAVLTLAASPLAFVFLVILLGGVAVGRRPERRTLMAAGLGIAAGAAVELGLRRAFPEGGNYPFSLGALVAALGFCAICAALTWRVARARVLRPIFPLYAAACVAAFVVLSALGGNITRLRFAAIPVAVLVFALREWRPRVVVVAGLACAVAWNVIPIVSNFATARSDPTASEDYWKPAVGYLRQHLTPSYRVEVVDTVGHWGAVYLPRAGIPITRGWFRQYDFPQNEVLYGPFGSRAYTDWLRGLGVRYVVLTDAPPDYSAQGEAALLRHHPAGLRPALRTPGLTIYAVSAPHSLITGPNRARVVSLSQQLVRLAISGPGRYRLALRDSAYWRASHACLTAGSDGMLRITVGHAGVVDLVFHVDAGQVLAALRGSRPTCPPV